MAGLPSLPPLPDESENKETAEEKAAKQKRLAELQTEQQAVLKKYSDKHTELQRAQQRRDEDAVIKLSAEIETILNNEYMPLMEERQQLTTTPLQQAMMARNALIQARSIKSLGVTDKHVFICTPPPRGYATEVWRVDKDFTNPKVIVKNLSGCCGQMNISAVGDKLVIPENGRFKVHVYSAEGDKLESWGDDEQTNAKTGWGSCCNPMNVAFDASGNILTSEASVGAIKRFTLDGKFIDTVATSKIVPGCKHTPIGMSLDGSKAYILDITRRNIIVMEKP
jgi:hypothetical protein